ncbi:MAG: hypothetical protein SF182_20470 [Deltaproteobacteria bacterium]|nr:hypothetical protein [Deltaproteobacteria bacterium]
MTVLLRRVAWIALAVLFTTANWLLAHRFHDPPLRLRWYAAPTSDKAAGALLGAGDIQTRFGLVPAATELYAPEDVVGRYAIVDLKVRDPIAASMVNASPALAAQNDEAFAAISVPTTNAALLHPGALVELGKPEAPTKGRIVSVGACTDSACMIVVAIPRPGATSSPPLVVVLPKDD